jgi:transposase
MVILGIDAHKRTHTVVAVDGNGRRLVARTFGTATADHLALLRWAEQLGPERQWAVEDCRHLSQRLERDLLGADEQVTRVPAKLMAHVRDSARTYGKSDPIDALAVARAALREPDLPTARLDGPDRDVRLLTDHRDGLVAERTRVINRLRWHLHELDPEWDPTPRSLDRRSAYDKLEQRLAATDDNELVVRLALKLVAQLRRLTTDIDELTRELHSQVEAMAPALLAIPGCAHLTAAKIIGETAGICRFASKDAYARHNGTAPLPVWSSNRARHRLSRTGNRQPAAQRRAAPHRHDPGPLPPRRQSHARPPQNRWRRRDGSPPDPQAPTLRRHLPSVTSRRPDQSSLARRLTEELVTQARRPRQARGPPTHSQRRGRRAVNAVRTRLGQVLAELAALGRRAEDLAGSTSTPDTPPRAPRVVRAPAAIAAGQRVFFLCPPIPVAELGRRPVVLKIQASLI